MSDWHTPRRRAPQPPRGLGPRGRGMSYALAVRSKYQCDQDIHPAVRNTTPSRRGASSTPVPGRGGSSGRGAAIFQQVPNPYSNTRIREVEDAVEKTLSAETVTAKRESRQPLRPGYGTQGSPVLLHANYFQLLVSGNSELFRYSVTFSREARGRLLNQIFNLLLEQHFSRDRASIASDFKSSIISGVDLLPNELEHVYHIFYKDEHSDQYPEKPDIYCARVIATGKLSVSQLLSDLSSTDGTAMPEGKLEVLQALNIVLGHRPKSSSDIISLGANRHFSIRGPATDRIPLGAGLEALLGYFVSVRAATAQLLVNCHVEATTCYQEARLGSVIAEYRRDVSKNTTRLAMFLKGLRVEITHIRRKGRKGQHIPCFKYITGLASLGDGRGISPSPRILGHGAGPRDVQFWLSDSGRVGDRASGMPTGRYMTVEEFFGRKYQITVDPRMPVVNVATRANPSYLPVEVCMVVAGQAPLGAKIGSAQTQAMIRFAARGPTSQAYSIVKNGAHVLGIASGQECPLLNFGIRVPPTLISVPGRLLPPPTVCYRNDDSVDCSAGAWNVKSVQVSRSQQLSSWAYLYIVSAQERIHFQTPADLARPLAALYSKLSGLGVFCKPVADGQRVDVTRALDRGRYDAATLDQSIAAAIRLIKSRQDIDLIFTILPSKRVEIYSSVKRVCDVAIGIHNVCVLAENFCQRNDQLDQYLANVCLKFNLKLGGANQVLAPDSLGVIAQGLTMVVGVDVTHPTSGALGDTPSVAGMVSSVDSTLAQWPADIRAQAGREEMVTAIDEMLESRLRLWNLVNRRLPENIIVYRDGVSDGQRSLVIAREIPLLKSACAKVYPGSDTRQGLPRLSVIIVGKRHHTRFFPTRSTDADKTTNPKNGLVVDRGVTEARNWDFFLQSHSTLRGTARPAHYHVVWDELFHALPVTAPFKNPADVLEHLTHNLCYIFGRATKAVSICPPAYYADLVCTRARCYLKAPADPDTSSTLLRSNLQIHKDLRNTMFYI